MRRGPLLRMRAFNSLSRDHTLGEVGERIATLIKLSTPSLGITRRCQGQSGRRRDPFNSLSRDHMRHVKPKCVRNGRGFQLPLSGSLLFWKADVLSGRVLSTPSLGIT